MFRGEKNEVLPVTILQQARSQPSVAVALPEAGVTLPDQSHHLAGVEDIVDRNQERGQRTAQEPRHQIHRQYEPHPKTVIGKLPLRVDSAWHVPFAPHMSDRRAVLGDSTIHKAMPRHVLKILDQMANIQKGVIVNFHNVGGVGTVAGDPAEQQIEVMREVAVMLEEFALYHVSIGLPFLLDRRFEAGVARGGLAKAEHNSHFLTPDVVHRGVRRANQSPPLAVGGLGVDGDEEEQVIRATQGAPRGDGRDGEGGERIGGDSSAFPTTLPPLFRLCHEVGA